LRRGQRRCGNRSLVLTIGVERTAAVRTDG
jgi:hypothetical protein